MPTQELPSSSLAGPSLVGSLSGSGPIEVNGSRLAWTFMVSAGLLECNSGQIVPALRKAQHQPGQQGNGQDLGRGEGAKAWFVGQGFVEVPHNFPTVYFGQKGSPEYSTYLNPLRGRVGELIVTHHHEVWTRPVKIGHQVDWEEDKAGRLQFLCDIRDKIIAPDGLSAAQIRIAVRGLAAEIRRLASREDSYGKALLATALTHMPLKHAPPDIQELIKLQKKPTTSRRKAG